jgi:hypothetical protein
MDCPEGVGCGAAKVWRRRESAKATGRDENMGESKVKIDQRGKGSV